MGKLTLPADIENYVHKSIAKRIVKCVLLLILFGAILYFWGERMFSYNTEFKLTCYIVVMILPLVISGVPIKLIDSTWRGEIIKVHIKEQVAFNTVGSVKGVPYTKHSIYLLVKTDKGRVKKILANEYGSKLNNGAEVPSQGKIEHRTEDYSVGDKVYHFYGLKHCFVVREDSEYIDCVVCGTRNKRENKECFDCGHELLKMN